MIRAGVAVCLCLLLPAPVAADGFAPVRERADFVRLVSGKALTQFGISLTVTPEGGISGRAFGRPVTGAWNWAGGYFCREMAFGSRLLAQNCQVVQRKGDTLRFIADEGRGDTADLKLR
ncbi:dihydrodipicolinate reductase [Paracoccaceae bacterium Fryx2]|nr:dihydrodipicolinate reductase [Paracoccaceae bacterium Fryx2]